MPQAFLTLFGLVTGFLNGAGLGALFLSFYPGAGARPELVALTAALILGPAGALAGVVTAHAGALGFQSSNRHL